MEILFKKSFIKDFEKLPEDIKENVKEICIFIFPKIKDLKEFRKYYFCKMKDYKNFYRIKIGNFRIGFKKNDNQIIFMRVLHRKNIYKYLPQ